MSKEDYLDVDPPVRGQKYVSLSYLCPEDILDDKNVFVFEEFLKGFSSQMAMLFDNLAQKYPDDKPLIDTIRENNLDLFDGKELQEKYRFFYKTNAASLEEVFHERNNFRTTIRGIKVRGVYANKKEGEAHIMKLKAHDKHHNIWLGEVGAWLPFADNPNEVENQTYPEESLNKLMKEYMKNREMSKEYFEKRHDEVLKNAKSVLNHEEGTTSFQVMNNNEDVWLKRKVEGDVVDVVEAVAESSDALVSPDVPSTSE